MSHRDRDIVIDKEFKDLLRKLSDQEYKYLEESIRLDGCREPLVVWVDNGKRILLGGHNRFAICREHGIDFQTIEAKNITNRIEAKIWILRDQLAKRNLNDFDRARFVLQFEGFVKEQAKQNQLSGLKQYSSSVRENSPKRTDTREVMAELAGVSSNTISKVKFINQSASKEQVDRLARGDVSINKIHQELHKQKRPRDVSKEIESFIRRFDWSINRETVPIGKKLLDHENQLTHDQKEVIICALCNLREFSNVMLKMLQREDNKKEPKEA